MEFLKEWITNIILFVLLATVIDMLLPNSKLQKYTKMVTGLLLITVIMAPILKILSVDLEKTMAAVTIFDQSGEKNMEDSIEMKKIEIQASQRAYILEQMAVQLEKDAEEELMIQYGLEIEKIELLVEENEQVPSLENLQKVMVQLKQPNDGAKAAVEVVKTVEINTEKPLENKAAEEHADNVASLLSQKWNVKEKTIEVLIERGSVESNG
ncbi:stage III sporulation protein AF [Cytobacillus spongiae]|jgi:stage III sporulation protein AF|uniref:stage III sporulation protein AF n=1 Tax=Cytobacillus spongiae TaxID=2901381 RepID=UPI001F42B254|nr:stage III sporulation protein AF [Cytobacillus spongiae]UII54806.1 stage III sporulation protein AF [Cytobacillus spongiae]